jgi:hypothetical protein
MLTRVEDGKLGLRFQIDAALCDVAAAMSSCLAVLLVVERRHLNWQLRDAEQHSGTATIVMQ